MNVDAVSDATRRYLKSLERISELVSRIVLLAIITSAWRLVQGSSKLEPVNVSIVLQNQSSKRSRRCTQLEWNLKFADAVRKLLREEEGDLVLGDEIYKIRIECYFGRMLWRSLTV